MKRFTKILSTFLAVLLLGCSTAYAAGNINVSDQQKDLKFPVSYICEAKGGTVSWDSKTATALYKLGSNTVKVNLKEKEMTVNGKSTPLKKEITGGRLILPLSTINSVFGLKLTSDECLKVTGEKFIKMIQNGLVQEGAALLSSSFSKYINAAYLGVIGASIKAIPFAFEKAQVEKNSVHQNLIIPCVIQQTDYTYIIRFDSDGKIDELGSALPNMNLYTKPDYDNPENYTEEQVTIGKGDWKLPGTLTLPKGKGPFPAVILVHGSGAGDRDETVGAVKPFRDLAVGLAGKNIAVLRYEKRTLEHGSKMQLMGDITMKQEFEEDAYAAAEFLKTNSLIDSSNIIVIGHSQGGYVLPRIMANDKNNLFKAGVIMSGCSRPIYELMMEQNEYLMSKGLASQAQIDFIKGQVNILKDPGFNPAQPPKEYQLGIPYYYDDMTDYNVLGIAETLSKPMLVLQGEKDWQVTVKSDFEGWKKAFESNKSAQFKLYPELNHVYTNISDSGTINDYYINANIPQYVIDDIGNYIKQVAGK